MQRWVLLIALGVVWCGARAGQMVVEVGDGTVDGTKIQPYEHTWRQCSMGEAGWTDGGTFTETMTVVEESGQHYLRHEQKTQRPDGGGSLSVTWLERETLAPVRKTVRVVDADGNEQGSAAYTFTPDGYTGHKTKDGAQETVSGKVSSQMYSGMGFGLPLATLDPAQLPAELSASMISFDGTYRVIATSAGTENLEINGRTVTVQLIDVEWHHHESGDVYPPGPDASGGRYWVVSDPPAGVPYVPRYKTDGYAIEAVQKVCPAVG